MINVFRAALAKFNYAELDHDAAIHVGVTNDFRIAYTNDAWARFARANGGDRVLADWGMGRSWLDALPGVLRRVYSDGLRKARERGKPFELDYECSSPSEQRLFHMHAIPIPEGYMMVHSLREHAPHGIAGEAPSEKYRDAKTRMITQCASCRRTRRPDAVAMWDWVPSYVAAMPDDVSHGLCESCLEIYYPDPGST